MQERTLARLLGSAARRAPDNIALVVPGRVPITYRGLLDRTTAVVRTLRAAGLGPGARVALMLPPGPELAVAFLGVAAGAGCAPLNPAYRTAEIECCLESLRPAALVVPAGEDDTAARHAAGRLSVPVFELTPAPDGAPGAFELTSTGKGSAMAGRSARRGDVALLLHTSGTTSRPKLIALTNENLCVAAGGLGDSLGLTERDRCLDVMPLFHIHGLMVLLASLATGGSAVCPAGFEASRFFGWVEECQPTWYSAVPTIHRAVLSAARERPATVSRHPFRFVRSCSAPLPSRLESELEEILSAPVIQAYGMTEASHQIATNPLPPRPRKSGSVGLAAGTQVAVLDAAGEILAPREIGEIGIRGPAVAANGQGWLQTGDEGYLDAEGYLFITGRLKEIINRGGEKVSPYEVEETLGAHPSVAEAVSFPTPHATLGEDVAAAVVLRFGAAVSEVDLRSFATSRLADFKIPSRILVVDRIPTGASGKPERLALAARLGLVDEVRQREHATPRTARETALVRIWADVLGLERVGIADNFFELGGDSISAFRILSRVGETLGIDVPVSVLFAQPTVETLAPALERQTRPHAGPVAAGPAEELPLTFAQERLWLAQELDPGTAIYNRPTVLRLRGALDVDALSRSLAEILRRHAVLRATFPAVDGHPIQRVVAPWTPDLAASDLARCPASQREAEARRIATEEARRPFALDGDRLARFRLLRLAPDEHVLVTVFHHIVYDGWSDVVFQHELATLYGAFAAGRPSPLPELAIQCADFARWHRSLVTSVADEQLAYWRGLLGARTPDFDLPIDHPRRPVQTFVGAREAFTLEPELARGLHALRRREGTTLFTALVAAFAALLHRYSGQDDIVVGSLVHGRSRREAEPLLGCFTNILPLRAELAGDPSFRALLARMREATLGALAHQDLPFDRLVTALRQPRDQSRSPIFQVMFTLRNFPRLAKPEGGLLMEPMVLDAGVALHDLTLEIEEKPGGLACSFDYNTDLLDRETVARMAGHFRQLVAGIVEDPDRPLSRLPLLTRAERRQLEAWNDTAVGVPFDRSFAEHFEDQVRRTPSAPAVIADTGTLTYAELNARANQLARVLVRAGVGPDRVVALLADRSPDLLVWIVAVLKAGGAYLPLDPRHPTARHATILQQSGAVVALVADGYTGMLAAGLAELPASRRPRVLSAAELRGDGEDAADLLPRSGPGDLAYVIFTSGSTGVPKGAMVEQGGMVNHLYAEIRDLGLTSADTVAQTASQCFDISVWQFLTVLLVGGRVRVIGDEVAHVGRRLLETVDRERITVLEVVPSLLKDALDTLDETAGGARALAGLRWLKVGGETLPPALCRRWLTVFPHVPLMNGYGPAECSDDIAHHVITEPPAPGTARVPIGRPIANIRIYVLDRALSPAPVGVAGELCVGGIGVGRGYLNDPGRTAEAFRPDPFVADPRARLYRTGDIARWRPDGTLEFLGRLDHQIKIRGHRVEPGEIEAALVRVPGVKEAMVAVWAGDGDARLVAWLVAGPSAAPPASTTLRETLRSTLPDYMVPELFVTLPAMPLSANGKIDRRALPAPEVSRSSRRSDADPGATRSPVQAKLAEIWAEVLGVDTIDSHDDFFDLGGHSLLATKVIARVRRAFQVELPLRAFFQAPTVAGLADLIAQLR